MRPRQRPLGPWDSRTPSRRVNHHGLSDAEMAHLVAAQGNRCMACGGPLEDPQVDHDHELARSHPHPERVGCKMCVRGVLDRRCNSALGFVGDDPARLRALADYVERARARR